MAPDALGQLVRGGSGLGVLALLLWWETRAPYLPLFARASTTRLRHALRNLALAAGNRAVTAVGFAGAWAAAALWAEEREFGLLRWAGVPPIAHAFGAILLLDAWTYCWHRLNHRVPFLWRFHRTHHADTQMDVTTASRFHLGEILISDGLRIPIIALAGVRLAELALYEALLLAVIQLHHANVGLPPGVDRVLRALIVTPAMHKVHHSRRQPETDSNYSSLLSCWDRLCRSFRLRDDPRTIRFGLDAFDAPEHQTLAGMLTTPLRAGEARRSGSR